MVRNGKRCKTLEILWWLQLSKRQILTFLPRLSFGIVRSEVRILSPRPVNSSIYGYLQRWPFLFCGRIVQNRSLATLTASTAARFALSVACVERRVVCGSECPIRAAIVASLQPAPQVSSRRCSASRANADCEFPLTTEIYSGRLIFVR